MSLHPDLSPLIGLPYKFDHSPRADLVSAAVNCQRVLHQAYESRLGIILPKGMWSQEIFYDESLIFVTVDQFAFEADIGIFGPAHGADPRWFHLAYFTGQKDESGDPILLHATAYDNQVSIWKLSDFFKKPRYGELKRIKRVKPDLFDTQVRPIIFTG